MSDDWKDKWSYSKQSTYNTCPYAFQRGYIEKDKGEENWFAELGSLVHSITEDYYKYVLSGGQPLSLEVIRDTMLKKFARGFVEVNFANELPPVMSKKTAEARRFNIENYFRTFVPDPNVIAVELHLEWELSSGHRFQGYVDEISQTPKGKKVLDIKSKYEKKYDDQLNTYCLGLKAVDGEYPAVVSVRGYTSGQTANLEVDPHRIKEILKTEQYIIKTIEKACSDKTFKAKGDKFFCNNLCNFRNNCKFKQ